MKLIWAITLVIFFSCSQGGITEKIEDADRIEVIDHQTGFSYIDTAKHVVEGFKELFTTKPQITDCPVQGSIHFKKGENVLLQVGFYKDASACNFVIVERGGKNEGYRLSFNTLVYLGLHFQELKKKAGAENR